MKTHTRFLWLTAIMFMTLLFVACGKDDAEPAPVTPPKKEEPEKKPNEEQQNEEEEEELCATNYNITSIVFPIHRNAGLSETITIEPDENNVFTERVYNVMHDYTRPYMMPANLKKTIRRIQHRCKDYICQWSRTQKFYTIRFL